MASSIPAKQVSVSFVTFKPENKVLFLGMREGDTLLVPPEITVKTVTGLLHKQLQSEPEECYDTIVLVTNVPPPPALMELVLKILKQGAMLVIECPSVTEMKKTLLFSGFSDLQSHSISEDRVQWECRKPEDSAPVKLTFGVSSAASDDSGVVSGLGQWSFADGADDTIDEAGLLDDEIDPVIITGPAVKTKSSDCEVGASRKPCANCTCGRKDEYAAEKSEAASSAASSGCGKCHLGDAFRCARCPYLGKPAFDPATGPDGPVKLDLSFADTDL